MNAAVKIDLVRAHFRLSKPCANCPFRKQGAIELEPGRVEEIIDDLMQNDMSTFHCHKTVHHPKGGDWDDHGQYTPSGHEAMCAGAAIYLEKLRRPTVAMRIGRVTGLYMPESLQPHFGDVIDP